jgi:hypothetical protein
VPEAGYVDQDLFVVATRDVDRLLTFFLRGAQRVDVHTERFVADLHEHGFVRRHLAVDQLTLDEREGEIARRFGHSQRLLR